MQIAGGIGALVNSSSSAEVHMLRRRELWAGLQVPPEDNLFCEIGCTSCFLSQSLLQCLMLSFDWRRASTVIRNALRGVFVARSVECVRSGATEVLS